VNPAGASERLERRREPRFQVTLSVTLDDASGMTRDVSASGVFFRLFGGSMRAPTPGLPIRFGLLLEHADAKGPVKVECEGEILRVEHTDAQGIAVYIKSYRFSLGEAVEAPR
jgi:hypothetical protein